MGKTLRDGDTLRAAVQRDNHTVPCGWVLIWAPAPEDDFWLRDSDLATDRLRDSDLATDRILFWTAHWWARIWFSVPQERNCKPIDFGLIGL